MDCQKGNIMNTGWTPQERREVYLRNGIEACKQTLKEEMYKNNEYYKTKLANYRNELAELEKEDERIG
jgi:hypothetical protein